MNRKRPKLPRNVWVLGFVSLLTDMSTEIYHALLPAFITVTLAMPALAMGAIDGISEATASFAKLASGRLSDRSGSRKPWVILGYGLAAASKPLFPLATSALPLLAARFIDRLGKGIRGAPRDAIIADETPPDLRGRAFGLRQALDIVGALIAPIAAIGLMILFAQDIRAVFWIAVIPAILGAVLVWVAVREPQVHNPGSGLQPFFAGFRALDRPIKRLLGVAFLFSLARFSEGFLVLRGLDLGLSPALSPLALVGFNLGFLALAYPAGALSDRIPPRTVLMAGVGVLIAANLVLSRNWGFSGLALGVLLWGAHMALTQGILARMVADVAPTHLRATSFGAFHFVTGLGTLCASLGAGSLWDHEGAEAAFLASAGVAAVALAMLSLLPSERSSPGA